MTRTSKHRFFVLSNRQHNTAKGKSARVVETQLAAAAAVVVVVVVVHYQWKRNQSCRNRNRSDFGKGARMQESGGGVCRGLKDWGKLTRIIEYIV